MSELSVIEQKRLYRLQMRQTLRVLSPERRQAAALAAYEVLSSLGRKAKKILSYASFGLEINLWPLNQEWTAQDKLVLPKVEHDHLLLFEVLDLKDLQANQWGILEPISTICKPIEPHALSFVLVPGLGFDCVSGHRLGYGLGYYDRLLQSIPSTIPCYGIGFKEQAISPLPFSSYDKVLSKHYLF